MASSSYYAGLMRDYSNKKNELEQKKIKWEEYLGKLSSLNGSLPNIISDTSSCNNSLLGGGYLISEGVSLDNGKLKEIISVLEENASWVQNVISKTQAKIQEFQNQIQNYNNLYNQASNNFWAAKRAEMLDFSSRSKF